MFSSLDNLTLCYLEDLHAKCFFNERELVLSTMNLYAFSERNNREMGVRVRKGGGDRVYSKALQEVFSIVESAEIKHI